MCQNLYFPTEDNGSAYILVAVTGIWKLLNNISVQELQGLGFSEREILQAKDVCEMHLDEAAKSMPIVVEQSYIQVQALTLLVEHV
jgi:hypothetical protein